MTYLQYKPKNAPSHCATLKVVETLNDLNRRNLKKVPINIRHKDKKSDIAMSQLSILKYQ